MNPNEVELIPPDLLAKLAEEEPRKVALRDYYDAMAIMREKGHSFAHIAVWMTEKLGVHITRSQVTYVLTTPPEGHAKEDEEEEMQDMADENT